MYSARFLLLTLSSTVELIVEELLFVLWFFFLKSAVSSSQGFGEEAGQTAVYLWTTCFDQ